MNWADGVVLNTGDRHVSGLIGEDGSAVVTWGQGDEAGQFVKAKVSYFSTEDNAWTAPSSLDASSNGIQKQAWEGGIQTLGAVASSILHSSLGGWGVWWRYCNMTSGGLCKNASSLSFSHLDNTKKVWSSEIKITSEYDVKAEESFRTFGGADGSRWLSGSDWIAPLSSDGIPAEKLDLPGVGILDSRANLYLFSGKTNSIVCYDSTTKLWTSYSLASEKELPINPHLIRHFEHRPGRLTFYWSDAAGTNSVRLWITEVNAINGARTVRTSLIDSGVSSYFGEAAASDESGVTLLSVNTASASRIVTAIRYDLALGAASTRQQLDVGALIDHASPLRLLRLGDRFLAAWESKSREGRVSVKAATLDRSGKMLSDAQELGSVESGKREISATIHALWLDASGTPNLVWNVFGDDINSWQSSVYFTPRSSWSAASTIQSDMPLTLNGDLAPVLLSDTNHEIAGIFYQGVGVAILSLSPSGSIESGTVAYPNALKASEYLSGIVHSDRSISILSRASNGRVWVSRSRR
jgi:hypothetical protein